MNLKDLIMQADDLPITPIEVPEWDCTCYVRTMTGAERMRLEIDLSNDSKNDGPALARVVCATLCNSDGDHIFKYPDDIEILNTKSVKALNRVFEAGLQANALKDSDIEDLKKT